MGVGGSDGAFDAASTEHSVPHTSRLAVAAGDPAAPVGPLDGWAAWGGRLAKFAEAPGDYAEEPRQREPRRFAGTAGSGETLYPSAGEERHRFSEASSSRLRITRESDHGRRRRAPSESLRERAGSRGRDRSHWKLGDAGLLLLPAWVSRQCGCPADPRSEVRTVSGQSSPGIRRAQPRSRHECPPNGEGLEAWRDHRNPLRPRHAWNRISHSVLRQTCIHTDRRTSLEQGKWSCTRSRGDTARRGWTSSDHFPAGDRGSPHIESGERSLHRLDEAQSRARDTNQKAARAVGVVS